MRKFWSSLAVVMGKRAGLVAAIGLLITAIATLVLVNTLELESISTAGSVGFLVIFGIVNAAGLRLAGQVKGSRLIPLAGLLLCAVALAILVHQQLGSDPPGVLISAGLIALCVLVEWTYKRSERRGTR